jgi:hypothetical protein
MDWQAFSDFIRIFGFPTFVVLLFGYLILVPRRDQTGPNQSPRVRSPRLVPGTVLDDLQDRADESRSSALLRAETSHAECEKQISYFRDLFNSERERFVAVNQNATEQTKLIRELRVEILESRKRAAK